MFLLQEESKGTLDAELATVLSSIALACKQISSLVTRAGVSNLTGVAGSANESVSTLRIFYGLPQWLQLDGIPTPLPVTREMLAHANSISILKRMLVSISSRRDPFSLPDMTTHGTTRHSSSSF